MSPYAVIVAGFALLFGAMLAVQLLAVTGREPFRPLGDALHLALANRFGRWVVLVLWLWTGFHFLAR